MYRFSGMMVLLSVHQITSGWTTSRGVGQIDTTTVTGCLVFGIFAACARERKAQVRLFKLRCKVDTSVATENPCQTCHALPPCWAEKQAARAQKAYPYAWGIKSPLPQTTPKWTQGRMRGNWPKHRRRPILLQRQRGRPLRIDDLEGHSRLLLAREFGETEIKVCWLPIGDAD